jgi:hypothetical protein
MTEGETENATGDSGLADARPWRAVAVTLLVVAATVVVATIREVAVGGAEVTAAGAAADAADWPDAVAHARAAAEAYVPGSPWPERGMQQLAALGHAAEVRGDAPVALLAYGAMRTAAVETRTPIAGRSPWQAAADEGLGRVAAAHEDAARAPAAAQTMVDALRRETGPGDTTLALLAVSAVAVLGGLGVLAAGPARSNARAAKTVAAIGFVTYAATLLVR